MWASSAASSTRLNWPRSRAVFGSLARRRCAGRVELMRRLFARWQSPLAVTARVCQKCALAERRRRCGERRLGARARTRRAATTLMAVGGRRPADALAAAAERADVGQSASASLARARTRTTRRPQARAAAAAAAATTTTQAPHRLGLRSAALAAGRPAAACKCRNAIRRASARARGERGSRRAAESVNCAHCGGARGGGSDERASRRQRDARARRPRLARERELSQKKKNHAARPRCARAECARARRGRGSARVAIAKRARSRRVFGRPLAATVGRPPPTGDEKSAAAPLPPPPPPLPPRRPPPPSTCSQRARAAVATSDGGGSGRLACSSGG